MGLIHSPSVVSAGLVLYIDAANTQSLGWLNPAINISQVQYLVVAGGGAAGGGGGGGGGGGVLTGFVTMPSTPQAIVVGSGGTGVATGDAGQSGQNSSAFGFTAIGGGGGGGLGGIPAAGGSGGGGNRTNLTGGAGTAGQGNAGGNGAPDSGNVWTVGGGGGGSGFVGQAGNIRGVNLPGNGGAGIASDISGTTTFYGGGGGGGTQAGTSQGGAGGIGGGGAGGQGATAAGTDGTANTGGGGGSSNEGGSVYGKAGNGGSGIVIIRYPGPQQATGGTVTTVAGSTVHTFTASGTFSPLIWRDLSSQGNNITMTSVGFTSGAVTYDGSTSFGTSPNTTLTTGNFFKDPNPFFATAGNTWTISAWFKFPVAPTGVRTGNSAFCLCGMNGGIGGGETMTLFVSSATDASLAPIPYICCVGIRGTKTVISPASVNTNTWNNVVVTWDGTAGRAYWNNTDRGALNIGTAAIQNGGFFNVGQAGTSSNVAAPGFMYEGDYGLLTVYNRALTADEVNQNFQSLRSRYDI